MLNIRFKALKSTLKTVIFNQNSFHLKIEIINVYRLELKLKNSKDQEVETELKTFYICSKLNFNKTSLLNTVINKPALLCLSVFEKCV